jgi:hypothetical protein
MHFVWRIYQGSINASTNTVQWQIFPNMSLYENDWFFGKDMLFYRHSANASIWMMHRNANE